MEPTYKERIVQQFRKKIADEVEALIKEEELDFDMTIIDFVGYLKKGLQEKGD
jgi:hypothetical protein